MYHNLFDSHTHSENSPDAMHSVTFMAENAVERGLLGLAVTDHVECDRMDEQSYATRIRQLMLDVRMARVSFGSKLVLCYGIELGNALFNLGEAVRVAEDHDYDVVLGAVHRVKGYEEFRGINYDEYSDNDFHTLMLRYFEDIRELIRWGGFDVLAHLSYPLRYPRENRGYAVDFGRYREQVDEILRLLAESGKGLELNTSGLRYAISDMMPPAWAISRFRELGGEFVTIGSDAHKAERVGFRVCDGMRALAAAGYEYFAFYRGRKPVMLRII